MENTKLLILTGISGSGKSTALNALEDLGYFCIENLPASLVMPFASQIIDEKSGKSSINPLLTNYHCGYALLVDCRQESSFPYVQGAVQLLEENGVSTEILFLDCSDEVAINRFRETRRKHPLFVERPNLGSIADALKSEREMLSDFRVASSRTFDTSRMSVHDLKRQVEDFCARKRVLKVCIQSFGFKYGLPSDVDMMFDVRFLPNPFFIDDLKAQTGLSLPVRDFVLGQAEAHTFLEHIDALLEFLLPQYEHEGKQFLNIGLGCTGGKHRSVALGEEISSRLKKNGVLTQVFHRDVTSDR